MGKFQDSVAKPRTSRGHHTYLDGGRKDLIKYGAPYNNARSVDTSNAFVAKQEPSNRPQEDLEEASIAGGVEGHSGGSFAGMNVKDENEKHKKDLKKKNEGIEMQSREEIVNEIKSRKLISRMLDIQKKRFIKESLQVISENLRLRKLISSLISEGDVEKSPHQSTAVNVLDQVFGKIKKNIEDGYKTLTTEKEQRDSYRRHLLSNVDDALKAEEVNFKAASERDSSESPEELEEIEINIVPDNPLDASDEDKVLPSAGDEGGDTEEPAEEKSEEEEFGIEGEELTGRDTAFPVFKQILEPITSGYKSLHNPNDREVYHDYLLTNMKMLMDQFEDQLKGVVEEPPSDSYNPDAEGEPDTPADPELGAGEEGEEEI